jgi:hypothetical protein
VCTPTLSSFTEDTRPAYIPVTRKRKEHGEEYVIVTSNQPKKPKNSSERAIYIFSANHIIQNSDLTTSPNCRLFHSPDNSIEKIRTQIEPLLVDSNIVRSVIFISDFKLNFSLNIDDQIQQIKSLVRHVETRGHTITFSFLPYQPANSKDPYVRTEYFPTPDRTEYIVKLNTLFRKYGTRNPLKAVFSNRNVGLSASKKHLKPQDWQGYDSAGIDETACYKNCYTYTQSILTNRSVTFANYVSNFLSALS